MGNGVTTARSLENHLQVHEESSSFSEFRKRLCDLPSLFCGVSHRNMMYVVGLNVNAERKSFSVGVSDTQELFFYRDFSLEDIQEMKESLDVNRSLGWYSFFSALERTFRNREVEVDFFDREIEVTRQAQVFLEMHLPSIGRAHLHLKLRKSKSLSKLRQFFVVPLFDFYDNHPPTATVERIEEMESKISIMKFRVQELEADSPMVDDELFDHKNIAGSPKIDSRNNEAEDVGDTDDDDDDVEPYREGDGYEDDMFLEGGSDVVADLDLIYRGEQDTASEVSSKLNNKEIIFDEQADPASREAIDFLKLMNSKVQHSPQSSSPEHNNNNENNFDSNELHGNIQTVVECLDKISKKRNIYKLAAEESQETQKIRIRVKKKKRKRRTSKEEEESSSEEETEEIIEETDPHEMYPLLKMLKHAFGSRPESMMNQMLMNKNKDKDGLSHGISGEDDDDMDMYDDDDDMDNEMKKVDDFLEISQIIKKTKMREDIVNMFNRVDDWEFDVFRMEKMTNGNALVITSFVLFMKYDMLRNFRITEEVLMNFLREIQATYHPNPYHNSMHAADVLQVFHSILAKGGMRNFVNQLQTFSGLIAAIVHDVDHPGVNNHFHVKSSSYLAMLYNDRSVLENHHSATAFEIMRSEQNNILMNLTKEDQQKARKMIIEMILATDMEVHNTICTDFSQKLNINVVKQELEDERARLERGSDLEETDLMVALKMTMKIADVSNPARPTYLYLQWADRLMKENFRQGDRERSLGWANISDLMNRKNQDEMQKGQIRFLNYVVDPMFTAFSYLCPKMKFYHDYCNQNKKYWQEHREIDYQVIENGKKEALERYVEKEEKKRKSKSNNIHHHHRTTSNHSRNYNKNELSGSSKSGNKNNKRGKNNNNNNNNSRQSKKSKGRNNNKKRNSTSSSPLLSNKRSSSKSSSKKSRKNKSKSKKKKKKNRRR